MSIVLVGSTSGSITLQEPAVAGSNTISLPAATGTAVLTGVSGNVDINAAGSNNVTLSTNSTERVRVDSSGNVGIGTTATDGVLTVNKANAGHKIVATNGTNAAWSEIGSYAGATNQVKAQLFAEENGASSYVKIGARSNHYCAFTTNDTERMRITSTGQLRTTVTGTTLMDDYGCRAWVNFNGTGTVAIRSSGNVSSITDHAVGEYGINFSNAFPDTNYSIVGTSGDNGSWGTLFHTNQQGVAPTTTVCRILLSNNNGTGRVDDAWINIAVFR